MTMFAIKYKICHKYLSYRQRAFGTNKNVNRKKFLETCHHLKKNWKALKCFTKKKNCEIRAEKSIEKRNTDKNTP